MTPAANYNSLNILEVTTSLLMFIPPFPVIAHSFYMDMVARCIPFSYNEDTGAVVVYDNFDEAKDIYNYYIRVNHQIIEMKSPVLSIDFDLHFNPIMSAMFFNELVANITDIDFETDTMRHSFHVTRNFEKALEIYKTMFEEAIDNIDNYITYNTKYNY